MIRKLRRAILVLSVVIITSFITLVIVNTSVQERITRTYNGPCKMPEGWRSETLSSKTTSNMNDWSYFKVKKCPKFYIADYPKIYWAISLQCNGEKPSIVSHTSQSSSDIFQIPFEDKCLVDFIQNCCMENRLVPNVVHYVWYSRTHMNFLHFLSFMSSVRFVKPCLILIHGPYIPYGRYWDYFVRVFPNIIHVKRNHTSIVGRNKLAFPEHGSDVMRIEALKVYGGLYLDWDEVILQSVDKFRDYDVTMGIETVRYEQMGSQFVMAKPKAGFLKLWHRSYFEDYRPNWTYNALVIPYKIARQLPDIIHVEGNSFSRPDWFGRDLIFDKNINWADNYAMHLYSRWYKHIINERTIGLTNTTLGSISRHILFGNKELCV